MWGERLIPHGGGTVKVSLTAAQSLVRGCLVKLDTTDQDGVTATIPSGTVDEPNCLVVIADVNTLNARAGTYDVPVAEFGYVPVINDGNGALNPGDVVVSGGTVQLTVDGRTFNVVGVRKSTTPSNPIGVVRKGCPNTAGAIAYIRVPR